MLKLLFLAGLSAAAIHAEEAAYEKLITKDAKTAVGVFRVHQIADKYYYEIPASELGKEFLWNTRVTRTTLGVGFGGFLAADRVVRWELNGKKVLLRDVNFDMIADPASAISPAVRAANNETIIMSFEVAATSPDGAPVIEVTRLFNTDVSEFNIRQRLGASSLDTSRSWVERISPYPQNIEAEATLTWTRAESLGAPGFGQMRPGSATIVVHHSMVKLPEKPMTPRAFDDRVGYFATNQYDYSKDEARAPRVRYIHRWRMDKPIVYYIDSATPVKWREWVKKGVESWQVAFEAAGLKNAIIAKDAPDPKQDPEFSPEDVRYSVIRWLPSTVENAFGPNVHDPRTGEILNADIEFYHNMMTLVRTWYITQVGPLDPRARQLPLPDDAMGPLIEYIIAHEVGHTLGLEHNVKASSLYPAEKVHDREWVHKMGHTPSIMDYARFNYVAQPEDGIPVEDLIPRVGPYDKWAIRWGYSDTPPDVREQDETRWYRYSNGSNGSDPGELTEAVGDADATASTALGLKNLRRVARMLVSATAAKEGESYEELGQLYNAMLGQWTTELNHVAAIVGGLDSQAKYTGQKGLVFSPVPKARQQAAAAFLNENAFETPAWAIDPEILRRIEPAGALTRIRNAQAGVLNNLLNSARFNRLVEQQAMDGAGAWSPAEFLSTVRRGLWREVEQPRVRIDAYRRNLQRAYLELANSRINGANGDEKPFYRAELKVLKQAISSAMVKVADRETREHLDGTLDQIARILDLRPVQPSSTVPAPGLTSIANGCWPEY